MNRMMVLAVLSLLALESHVSSQVAPTWAIKTGSPSLPYSGYSAAYDEARQIGVVFGGQVAGSSIFSSTTWTWDGSVLSPFAAPGPSSRCYAAMAYDPQSQKVILFGGLSQAGTPLADTWAWDGVNWVQISVQGPSGRHSHSMAYDGIGSIILFGGETSTGNQPNAETWRWFGSGWQPVLVGTGPSARSGHGMAYSPRFGGIILYGGGASVDTWIWSGGSWSVVATPGFGPREGHGMAYDEAYERIVVAGGTSPSATTLFGVNPASGSQVPVWFPASLGGSDAPQSFSNVSPIISLYYDRSRGRCVTIMRTIFSTLIGPFVLEFDSKHFSETETFGVGCGAPFLSLDSAPGSRPVLGSSAQAQVANSPSNLVFMALGWSRSRLGAFNLPLSLVGYGMPGCELLQSCEVPAVSMVNTGTGTASYSMPIPNLVGLIGLDIFLQGWAFAPGVNAGNTVVSNGLRWRVGRI